MANLKFTIQDRQFEHQGELPPVTNGNEGCFSVAQDGKAMEVFTNHEGLLSDGFAFDGLQVAIESERERIVKERFANAGKGGAGSGSKQTILKAPMPGLVKKILVAAGAPVSKDTPVIILEAMKMENVLTAGKHGILGEIKVSEGKNVEKNAILATINEY